MTCVDVMMIQQYFSELSLCYLHKLSDITIENLEPTSVALYMQRVHDHLHHGDL